MKTKATVLLVMIILLSSYALADVTVEFADKFQITHPETLTTAELTEDDLSEGMVYSASGDYIDLYIWQGDMDGMTRDELYAVWQQDDYLAEVVLRNTGEYDILCYNIETEGKGAVIAGVEDSYYEIMCFYESDVDDVKETAEAIMASIAEK